MKSKILNTATFIEIPTDIFWKLEKALGDISYSKDEVRAIMTSVGVSSRHQNQIINLLG